MEVKNKKHLFIIIKIIFLMILTSGNLWAIKLESNALVDGLVKMFPTLKDEKSPFIDFDKSGDSRCEQGVPEIIWDRPGDGEGIIQAQEILDAVVYKDNFRYLKVEQLQEIINLLNNIGKAGGKGIMTEKVARSYVIELEGLVSRRKELPDIVTQNERKRVLTELSTVIQRMSKQYTEEADKEASATFKGDLEKFKEGMEVVIKTEDDDPMKLPLNNLDSDANQIKGNMVRILGDEVKNYNERYISNKTAIFSIGKIGGRSALNILVNILQDQKFAKEINYTIHSLGMIGEECTPEVVEKIGEYLEKSNDPEVKSSAIKTLGRVGNKKSIALLKKYVDSPPANMEQLRGDGLEALVNIAENERQKGIPSAEIVPIFKDYTKSSDQILASYSIKGLALAKNTVPFPEILELIKLMNDFPDVKIINNILETIELVSRYNPNTYRTFFAGAGESKSIFNYLTECFTGKYKGYFARNPHTRTGIARLIKEVTVGVPYLQGIDLLVDAITDDDPLVRDDASSFLIQISNEYKVSANTFGLTTSSVQVLTYKAVVRKKNNPLLLEKGLQVISKQTITSMQIAEFYFPHLSDLDVRIVRQAVRGLRSLLSCQTGEEKYYRQGQLELVRALIVKNTLPIDIRIAAVEVAGLIGFSDANSTGNNIVKALYEILQDRNSTSDLKISAILAFPRLKEKQERTHQHWIALKDVVVDLIGDDDINIRAAVVGSLKELNLDRPEIRKALYTALADEKNITIYYDILDAVRVINNPGSSGPLRDFLVKEKKLDPRVKKITIVALGNCGDPDMVDILIDALNDPETEKEARRGLEQIDKDELQKRVKQKIRMITDEKVKKELESLLKK